MNRGDTAADVLLQNVGQYIEHFIDYVENVPNDLIRQISQLHEKNHYFHQCLRKLESTLNCTPRNGDGQSVEKKSKNILFMLQKCLTEIQATSDEKLFLVQSMYDTLDMKARSLDHDYRCVMSSMGSNSVISPMKTPESTTSRAHYFESNYYHHHSGNSQADSDDADDAKSRDGDMSGGKVAASNSMEFVNNNDDDDDSYREAANTSLNSNHHDDRSSSPPLIKSPSKRGGKRSAMGRGGARESSGRGGKRSATGKGYGKGKDSGGSGKRGRGGWDSLALEEKIETEPVYCICQQISFGEMIACENDSSCPNGEWFHFQCVNLSSKPKGKWYCPACRGDRSNVPKK